METQNHQNIINEQVDDIFDRAKNLRELTYSYLDLGSDACFNTTLFIDYLGIPQQLKNKKTISLYLKTQGFLGRIKSGVDKRLSNDIEILEIYLEECDVSEKDTVSVYISALKFTREAVDFELEKVGYTHGLSEEEIQEKTQKLQKYDAEIFGEHVSENPDFLRETYAYLKYQIDTYGPEISNSQKIALQKGLKAISHKIICFDSTCNIDVIPKYSPPRVSEDFKKLSQIKISREDYARIFDIYNEISGVPQRSLIGDFTSFTDGDDIYGIPNSESYTEKTLAEILRLAPHETGHYINLQVTRDRGDGKHHGDLIKEEGLAKFTEALIQGIPLENMSPITFSAPSVVLSKLMNGNEFTEFEDAYLELLFHSGEHSKKRNLQASVLRKKRGFSMEELGSSNKDAAYSLGMFSVLQYIKNGKGSIKNLFGGKISMNDVESGDFFPDDFGNKYISHILLSELIVFYLSNKDRIKIDKLSVHEEFVAYLKDKYKEFSEEFGLFSQAEKFMYQNKRKVVEILGIIEKSSQ